MPKYGLIGQSLSHSFSKSYFTNKFEREGIVASYANFEISSIAELHAIFKQHPEIKGLNVTIPFKEVVLEHINELTMPVALVGACNTIKVERHKGRVHLKAYNTDVVGFEESLKKQLLPSDKRALILGNGGVAKAVAFVLSKLQFDFKVVARRGANTIPFEKLNEKMLKEHSLIINTTPLGTFPNLEEKPLLPYQYLHANHYMFDMVYNPNETAFLKEGKKANCRIQNGLQMLELQAEAAWKIWNE